MHLSGIYIYPVKSCAGPQLQATGLDRFGPEGDRRWMVVGESGDFITQRDIPHMALIRATPVGSGLQLRCGDAGIEVDTPPPGLPLRGVRVWSDRVQARDVGDEAAAWLSGQLGRSCRLVYMPGECVLAAYRRVNGQVLFGQNLLYRQTGRLAVGDAVEVLA